MLVLEAISRLSLELTPPTWQTAYVRFTPSDSGQRLPLTYYRGCWHVISRGFLVEYRQTSYGIIVRGFLPPQQNFTTRRPSSFTRHCSVRLSPIAEDSLLLPPVGVWTVSQF